jgi:hypothetical protein
MYKNEENEQKIKDLEFKLKQQQTLENQKIYQL